jgi:salicylate hydroxylase
VARSRSIVIAGAGIGGLTAALALARAGFRTVVLEQARRLEETGAGIQLSPNAVHVLADLGLARQLASRVVAPEAIRILRARSGRELARVPLGASAQARYGAPYWVIHRADLQAVLIEAVDQNPNIALRLGARVDDFALHSNGVTVQARVDHVTIDELGIALIAADGVWSDLRGRFSDTAAPRFARRTAWRAVVPALRVPAEFRAPTTHLWLGAKAHLVHYPVNAGRNINIVAIIEDEWHEPGWSAVGRRDELLARFAKWAAPARDLLALPDQWLKWALFDRASPPRPGHGPFTLLGDAAHPVLPFLAQGGALAIEDAAVLAARLADNPDDPAAGLRAYEKQRRARTTRVQRAARAVGRSYHLRGPAALVRNTALAVMGGGSLLGRYDWLYGWRAD